LKTQRLTSLGDDLVQDIVQCIAETAQPGKLNLFGSRARGNARPDSDLDVLVIKQSDEPGYRRDTPLYLALAGLNAPVDFMVYTPEEVREWRAVSQAFITTAVREGKVVYE
jgi:predicted nucleotidyltransferase